MAITKLIAKTDFTGDLPTLPTSMDASRLNHCIIEAQEVYLRPLVGDAMYNDLLKNAAVTDNAKLLNGEEYTDPQGVVVQFAGLKYAVAYWTLAVYAPEAQDTYTSHSLAIKTNGYSEPLSDKAIGRKVSHYKAVAGVYWDAARKYIEDRLTAFPLYNKSVRDTNRATVRINAVGGTGRINTNECKDYNT